MKIKYDISLIGLIALFEKTTHAQIKDCFQDDVLGRLTFVVQPGELPRAVGKFGANVKHLEAKLNKKIRIVAFDPDKLVFIRNMVLPLQIQGIEEVEEGNIVITGHDTQTKGLIIGRNAANLRNLEQNCRRYFPEIKEIRVV